MLPPLERKVSTLENYIQETREVSALGMFETSFLGWSQPTRRMLGSSDFYCNHFWGPLAVTNTCARLSWSHKLRSGYMALGDNVKSRLQAVCL